jgi:hypothetical protein
MKNQTTSARRITLADHFNTRFSFTELLHSDYYFAARVALPQKDEPPRDFVARFEQRHVFANRFNLVAQLRHLVLALSSLVAQLQTSGEAPTASHRSRSIKLRTARTGQDLIIVSGTRLFNVFKLRNVRLNHTRKNGWLSLG